MKTSTKTFIAALTLGAALATTFTTTAAFMNGASTDLSPEAPTEVPSNGSSLRTGSHIETPQVGHLGSEEQPPRIHRRTAPSPRSDGDARNTMPAAEDVIAWVNRISGLDAEEGDAEELQTIAREHANPEIRALAIEELADADTPETLDALIHALEDADPDVVLAAVDAMEMLDADRALPALDQVARAHSDAEVREAALEAIEFIE